MPSHGIPIGYVVAALEFGMRGDRTKNKKTDKTTDSINVK
jgi:hypothetical protein